MQTFVDNCFDENNSAYDDLQNIENNFAALKSNFSGVSSPSNAVAGMDWFDSDNHVNKRYDAGWLGLMHGDTAQKIWVYRNDSIPGWVIDSSVGDVVMAAKGAGVYGTAGVTAGSWVISGVNLAHTHSFSAGNHNHKWYNESGAASSDQTYDSSGNAVTIANESRDGPSPGYCYFLKAERQRAVDEDSYLDKLKDSYTDNQEISGTTGSAGSAAHNGLWRIAAAVNTLQVLNI